MTPSTILRIALTLWTLAIAASVAVVFLVPASGDGLTRGLNRVEGFLGWQAVAAGLALVIWVIGNRCAPGTAGRRLSRVPAAAAGLLVAGIVALIAGTMLFKPAPQVQLAPKSQVTAPVAE